MVDRQYDDRRSANGRQAYKARPAPAEMLAPNILTRMEEAGEERGFGVNARKVGAFCRLQKEQK